MLTAAALRPWAPGSPGLSLLPLLSASPTFARVGRCCLPSPGSGLVWLYRRQNPTERLAGGVAGWYWLGVLEVARSGDPGPQTHQEASQGKDQPSG